MKKIILMFAVVALFISCDKKEPEEVIKDIININNSSSISNKTDNEVIFIGRPKFKVKHSGNSQCGSCGCPFGICIGLTIELESDSYTLTTEETQNDLGLMTISQVSESVVKLKFLQPTILENGTIPIDGNMTIDYSEFNQIESVVLHEGLYQADSEDGEFGSCLVYATINK